MRYSIDVECTASFAAGAEKSLVAAIFINANFKK